MGARKPGQWTDEVYRVRIDHLYADGVGSYLTQTYGPYTTLTAAKTQAGRLLKEARRDSKKAQATIEASRLDWYTPIL
jgi:hypothetical protein